MRKDKVQFIVIEGIDGAGKSTQTELLLKFFKKQKRKTSYYKFPQYQKNVYGRLIADFLAGKLGSLDKVNPYLISLAYALDRASVRDQILKDKKSGKLIVVDRYSASNKAYQAPRLNKAEQERFISWLDDLDYKVNHNVAEDLNILLDIPVHKALELINERKKDLLEKESQLEETRKIYLKLAKEKKRWIVINCLDNKGQLKTKPEIHKEIVEILSQKNII